MTRTAKKKISRPAAPQGWVDPLAPKQPLVSGLWLFRALLFALGGAAVCAYLTICLLFWQGQWQIVFHPSQTVSSSPASAGIVFDEVRFDTTETGEQLLYGWWIPAESSARYAKTTVLLLHDGHGSISDTLPYVTLLHRVGVNLFVFDYRGFGRSKALHPSESRMQQDSEAALAYLTESRKVPLNSVVVYGRGLGASLAADLAGKHHALAGLILDTPSVPALQRVQMDPRTKLLPLRLLFEDRFEVAPKLQELNTPKLFLTDESGTPEGYKSAANPKTIVYLKRPLSVDRNAAEAISRFLGD